MVDELLPVGGYVAELAALWSLLVEKPWGEAPPAALALLDHLMLPLKAVFYAVVVNVIFFAYCYRALAFTLALCLSAARFSSSLVLRAVSCCVYLFFGSLPYKGASRPTKNLPTSPRKLWVWFKGKMGLGDDSTK